MVGHRQVLLEDRKKLHLTNAVVHETQRVANIAPTALPHMTNQDVVFQGHFIKKGSCQVPPADCSCCSILLWVWRRNLCCLVFPGNGGLPSAGLRPLR